MEKNFSAPPKIGRPPSAAAASHAAIMDAVYELLQQTSARDLTMESVAKRAGVGKPTLYKWWGSKAALIFAMFRERLAGQPETLVAETTEQVIRDKVQRLIREFNGLFGKVMADLIAEGQSEPEILSDLYDQHMSLSRASTIADVERGKIAGEFAHDTNADLLLDSIFGPIYFRLLLRDAPLTEKYGDELVNQVLRGVQL